jgi:hypothetical protein
MRRELFLHFAFWFSFFLFVAIVRQYFSLGSWSFWLGGLVGIFLPDLDHIIYVYFVQPQELTSLRVNHLVGKKDLRRGVELLYETRGERRGLIFHTVFFQLIFLVLTFWMMSSSGSLFGKGLVLSFALHLSIDQIVDLTEVGNFDNWLRYSPIQLDFKRAKNYWLITLILLCIMGFLM